MGRGLTRSERLDEMKRLYVQRAFSDIEMAKRLDVDRTTVYKDRVALEGEYPFIQDEHGRWQIDRKKLISEVKLNLHEALALYLAARRVSRQTRIAQPHVANALEKLAVALRQPMTERLVKAAGAVLTQAEQPERVKVLEAIAEGWVSGQKVRITHQGLRARRPQTYTVSPYLIEPSLWGDGTYVIGYSDVHGDIATFKVERIERAVVTGEPFTLPENFDEQELLRHAWGIWYGEGELERVVLRFAPGQAARRVKESIWHPNQEPIVDTEDGGCIWSAQVAEWREMVPWVRGWGADVEVVEPKELRGLMVGEARRLARIYRIATVTPDPNLARLLRCWGKTSESNDTFHPALYHMLDVANVARALLSPEAPPRWRRTLADALMANEASLESWVPYLASMHDIGKISVAFQVENQQQAARLKREGFPLDVQSAGRDRSHATLSQTLLNPQVGAFKLEGHPKLTKIWSEAMGGHHGRFVDTEALKEAWGYLTNEPAEWDVLRQLANRTLREVLLKADALPEPANVSTAVMALTGFTVLCDWIGSDERHFRPAPDATWGEYLDLSRERAEKALRANGFLEATTSTAPTDVESLFDDLGDLRPLQRVVDEVPDVLLEGPVLAIVEAPTGEGKTEAALALARRIAAITGTDELFYALPTMATSNQMFKRLEHHLHERLDLDVHVKLAHGQALLVEEDLRKETPMAGIESLRNGERGSQRDPMEWFSGKKRALLAPFGVGTVDQAELTVLNARHAALRMMSLAGKVVIVDEVHAYDVYMTTIIEQLLRWLAAMNTSVILLSATLPTARRAQLARAYGVTPALDEPRAKAYPNLLVLGTGGSQNSSPVTWQPDHAIGVWQPDRRIELHRLRFGDDEARAKAEWLLARGRDGGCVCWIANTVRRAQDIFEALEEIRREKSLDVSLGLLHSQFPQDDRLRREEELAGTYGRDGAKTGKRPARGIVIGTQVLEQSLDLDFDVMASDLAPMDFLLQRAGRLHRHERERPAAHATPRLWLNFQEDADGNLVIGSDRTVYAEFIMRQTHRILGDRLTITLPADYRTLVDAVYTDAVPPTDDPLAAAWNKLQNKADNAIGEARERLLPDPHPRDSFAVTAANKIKFLESETRADWLVAKTRLGERTLNVIPLARTEHLARLPDGETVDVNAEASRAVQLKLLRRHLRISHPAAIEALEQDAETRPTALFTQSTLLKDFVPLWLTDGQAGFPHPRGKLIFTLEPQLGLRIRKEKVYDGAE